MKCLSLLFTLILGSIGFVKGQTIGKIDPICDTCNQQLYLRIDNTSFIKNNEYSNQFTKGFTGIGFMIKPTLEYYFTDNTRASAGIHLLKYSGKNGFTQAIPLFNIRHKLNDKLDLILGNLYGNVQHGLDEPLFRSDRFYQNNVEYGLQLLWRSDRVKSDIWVNWEQFIFNKDPLQEAFVFGTSSQVSLLKTDQLEFSIPLQTVIYHKGGQIDISPEPILSILNASMGISIRYYMNSTSSIRFEPKVLIYEGLSVPDKGVNHQLFKDGSAFYLRLIYEQHNFSSSLGYWSANQFIAPRGEFLFQSVSDFDPIFTQNKRELLSYKASIKKTISDYIHIELRGDLYFDLLNNNFDYSTGLYFAINEPFRLK